MQVLLQQIDEVLNKTNPRLPWVMSSDAVQQRQVLEQTRDYLLLLQQNGTSEAAPAESSMATVQSAANMEASAQQVLQAVVQEMNYLRSNMMQPLRSDVEMLRMQRDALAQEIRQLEMQRQQYELPQQNPQYLTEFLQAAMSQMQENLTGQFAQMLATQAIDPQRLAGTQTAGLLAGESSALSPVERLKHLQMLQAQSDQLMLRLDTTLRTVFESLQHNLQSYQDSLEEGLGRMHDMGQQGEAVFGAFVTRLGQILGREASSFLQSPQTRSDRPALPGQKPVANHPDAQIKRLLEELNALDQTALNQSVAGEPIPFNAPASPDSSPEAELENLKELDRVLSQLDLSAIPEAEILDEEDLALLQEQQASPFAAIEDDDRQTPPRTVEVDPDWIGLRSAQIEAEEDLESAIDLLNQITAETPTQSRRDLSDRAEDAFEPPELEPEPTLIADPDALYADEWYETRSDQAATSTDIEFTAFDRPDDSAGGEDSSELQYEELEQADATTDLDAGLFAGLTEFEEPDQSSVPIASANLPQSLENQLLQSPQSSRAPQHETLDAFFDQEEIAEEEDEEEIETIAALTDLIPPTRSDTSPFFVEPPRLLDITDEYGSAQLGEDLFLSESGNAEAINAETSDDLDLSPDSLQQLSADLFNLEDAPYSPPAETFDRAGWTLGDWQDAPSVEPVQPTEGIEWSLTDIPSVLLSRPFSGEMTAEDLLFTDELTNESTDQFTDILPPGTATSQVVEHSSSSETAALNSQRDSSANDFSANDLVESTLEDWFSAVDAAPVVKTEAARANETDGLDETDDLNAFTLDGLDSLFEGVPSIDPASPSALDTQTVTVDNIFADWTDSPAPPSVAEHDQSINQAPPAPSSPEMQQQKKKFGPRESAE